MCRHFAIPDQRREINDGIICAVFQTYRYLIRESEIYFQQVLLYLGFENEYYFSLYDIFGNCLFFLYLNKIMLCFVNIMHPPSYRSFQGIISTS